MHLAPTDRRCPRPVVAAALAGAVLALSACSTALMDPRGPIAREQRTILIDSMAIMLAIVIPTIIATLAFAWWFRASNKRARYLPTWAFSGSIELVVWSIPVLVVLLLSGVTWIGSYQLDPAKPIESKSPPLEIQVVSLDWKWLFIYPDHRVAVVNELVVPAGVPLHFTLTSASVMNTFFVPQLGSMIYTMNGMATQLWLHADEPGNFRGLSTMISGDGFSDMHFFVRAVPAADFEAWLGAARGQARPLDTAVYTALMRQSVEPKPILYGSVEDGLFDRVVSQHLPPGPGPSLDHAGTREK